MKILKRLLAIILAAALVFLAIGLLLPSKVHVERSTWIDAPPANVFTLLNGYKRFNDWSPWADLDPEPEYRYEGPEAGVGATMHWTGDGSVGSGWQMITAAEPYSRIEMELAFGPEDTARTAYHLAPEAGGTQVTWAMDVDFGWDILGRYMSLMFDRWVGADYEKGLASLKALVESLPKHDLAGAEVEVIPIEPISVVMLSGETSHDLDDVEAALQEAYARLERHMAEQKFSPAGPPMAIAREWSNDRYVFDAALPYRRESTQTGREDSAPETEGIAGNANPEPSDARFRLADAVHAGMTPGGRAARIVHAGPHETLADSWNRLEAFIALRGLEPAGDPWEVYVTDPADVPAPELVTHIFWPVE